MLKNELQVVKSNQVIEASYQLSTIEQRLVLAAISHIPKGQTVTDEVLYTVSVADLQLLGVNQTTAYRDIKEGVNKLYERSIHIWVDNKSIKIRWVQEIQFMDSQGVIGIRFSKPLLPFISNLSREFTKYALSDIAGMSSAYAIRVYELIAQYKSLGQREIAVVDLRNMLELGTRYVLFADLKRWVIDMAVDQINQYSPLNVSYKLKKTGKKVSHVVFYCEQKAIKLPSKIKIKEVQKDVIDDKILDEVNALVGRFDRLSETTKQKIIDTIESELKGRKLAHFNIEYTVYQKTKSSTVFRDFKDFFIRALANVVVE